MNEERVEAGRPGDRLKLSKKGLKQRRAGRWKGKDRVTDSAGGTEGGE